jgi:hypothetical protein
MSKVYGPLRNRETENKNEEIPIEVSERIHHSRLKSLLGTTEV